MKGNVVASWGVVILCATAGLAQAQYRPKTHPNQTELPPGQEAMPYTHSKNPILDKFRTGRPIGCWASFNGYGCSSVHSTWSFVFGSCRDFFSEPCLKTAPPSPLPPYAEGDGGRMPPRPYYGANGNDPPPRGIFFHRDGRDARDGRDGGPCRNCPNP